MLPWQLMKDNFTGQTVSRNLLKDKKKKKSNEMRIFEINIVLPYSLLLVVCLLQY